MNWYGGSIAEAVTLSKKRNAIFVVFVEGNNDLSVEMATSIEDINVLKRLSDENNFVAIKFKSDSQSYMNFAQIYQFVPVPSLFFIGRNGTPLEVVCAGVQPANLAQRIDKILEQHHKEKQPSQPQASASTSSHNIKQQTTSLIQSEAAADKPMSALKKPATEQESPGPAAKVPKTEYHEVTRSGQEYEVVCDGDVCVRKPKTDGAGPSGASTAPIAVEKSSENPVHPTPSESSESIDDKLERAKALIEAQNREKAEKEKELEKQKEMERRVAGKGVAELKRWQADQEMKQIQEERKREKMENNLARQRILEQIAQDRAERRAREAPQPAPVMQHQQTTNVPATSGDGGTQARIQFKMPDGNSHTAHFDAGGTLGALRQYVADNLRVSASSFTLWTAFPRRELVESESTLRDLQLVPSAAILVLSRQNTVAASHSPSAFSALITFLTGLFTNFVLTPTQQAYEWLRSFVSAPNTPRPTFNPTAPASTPATGVPPSLRRRTNIHGLPEDRSGSDDNNTWNGNSTQQM